MLEVSPLRLPKFFLKLGAARADMLPPNAGDLSSPSFAVSGSRLLHAEWVPHSKVGEPANSRSKTGGGCERPRTCAESENRKLSWLKYVVLFSDSAENMFRKTPGAFVTETILVGGGGSPSRMLSAKATPVRTGEEVRVPCQSCRLRLRCSQISPPRAWLKPPAARMLSTEKLRCIKLVPAPGDVAVACFTFLPMALWNASSSSCGKFGLPSKCGNDFDNELPNNNWERWDSPNDMSGWVSFEHRKALLECTKWLGCPAAFCLKGEHTAQSHAACTSGSAGGSSRGIIALLAPRPSRRRPARSGNAHVATGTGSFSSGCAGSSGCRLCNIAAMRSSCSAFSASSTLKAE
mmetsp:Transcript_74509/g.216071  ORF Transcript_74509/g.216071 Transcript_74509/m.216071 type:complete len:349 (+) Transcript_74509:319-1365(+)